jgi:cyclohexadieny/prephenate dehydrogenase
MSFDRIAIIGLGLLGGSIGLALKEHVPSAVTTGYDADPAARTRAAERGLVSSVCDSPGDAVRDADLVILCVPVGTMEAAAQAIAPHLKPSALVSDVGSSKQSVANALAARTPLPGPSVRGRMPAFPACSRTAGASSPRPPTPIRRWSRRWQTCGRPSAPRSK